MKTKQLVISVVVVVFSLMTTAVMAKGPPVVEETVNNLSFPAIGVDGFSISQPRFQEYPPTAAH